VTVSDAAGCCGESSWGSVGGSKGSSSESGTESVNELSVDGVDVPVDGVDVPVDEGVTVAARSRGANLPLTRG
jgi:hypothetical protein